MTNDVSPQVMLAFLNDAWLRAAEGANTFRERLLQDQSESLALVRKGSLASVGKNSASQSYKSYGPATITQVQAVEIIGNLLGLYDQLKSRITEQFELSDEFDNAVPADFDFDAPIYDLMTKVFNAQSSGASAMLPDITRLRVPATFILQQSVTTA